VEEQAAAAEERAKSDTGPVSEETLRALSHSAAHIAHGGELFAKNGCTVCHGPEATGLVGPNLRDDYWIYGHDMSTIVDVITNGRANGTMPPQKANLAPEDIRDLACWIVERARSDKSAGKPPDTTREKLAPIDY
jgi:cbb3-type cytochrome c oxidase subunit III